MDGVEGLEPPNDWTKTSCLTTWRYPSRLVINSSVYVDGIIAQSILLVKTSMEKDDFSSIGYNPPISI